MRRLLDRDIINLVKLGSEIESLDKEIREDLEIFSGLSYVNIDYKTEGIFYEKNKDKFKKLSSLQDNYYILLKDILRD